MKTADKGGVSPQQTAADELFWALHALSCVNTHLVESEAERRRDARDLRSRLLNSAVKVAASEANRKAESGASLGESFPDLSPLIEHAGSAQPEAGPLTETIREEMATLIKRADDAAGAVRRGGAEGLDRVMAPNAKGQPRSVELALLLDEARSLAESIQRGALDTRVVIDKDARRLRVSCERLAEIRGELRVVTSKPVDECSNDSDTRGGSASDHGLRAQDLAPEPVGAQRRGSAKGVTAFAAQQKAEAIVKAEGFPKTKGKPSVSRLAKRIPCHYATMKKAIDQSRRLQTALSKANAPPPQDELAHLVAEQTADDKSRHA